MTIIGVLNIFCKKVWDNSVHSELPIYTQLHEATCKSAKCIDPLIRWITNHSDIVSIRLPVCIFELFYIKNSDTSLIPYFFGKDWTYLGPSIFLNFYWNAKWHNQRNLQIGLSLTKVSYFYLKWSFTFVQFVLDDPVECT